MFLRLNNLLDNSGFLPDLGSRWMDLQVRHPCIDTFGLEEKMAGKWLKMGNKAKYRFSDEPAMYDHLGANWRCSHELVLETLAVHRLYSSLEV